MIILGVDAVSTSLSLAIQKGETLFETNRPGVRDHNQTLIPALDALLKDAAVSLEEIDAIALGAGPGSFTALRVALSSILAIAYAKTIPVYAISSLEALLTNLSAPAYDMATKVALIDARKHSCYVSARKGSVRLLDERDMTVDSIVETLKDKEDVVFVGDGYARYKEYFDAHIPSRKTGDDAHIVPAKGLIRLADARRAVGGADALFAIAPRYVRMSEAEYNAARRKGTTV